MRTAISILLCLLATAAFAQPRKHPQPVPVATSVRTVYTYSVYDCHSETDEKSGKTIWKFVNVYVFDRSNDSLTEVISNVFLRGTLIQMVSFDFYGDKLSYIEVTEPRTPLLSSTDPVQRYYVVNGQLVHHDKKKVNEAMLARYFENAAGYLARSKTFTAEDRSRTGCP